jgi:hypothetical protein
MRRTLLASRTGRQPVEFPDSSAGRLLTTTLDSLDPHVVAPEPRSVTTPPSPGRAPVLYQAEPYKGCFCSGQLA